MFVHTNLCYIDINKRRIKGRALKDKRREMSESVFSPQTSLKWAIGLRWIAIISLLCIAAVALFFFPFKTLPVIGVALFVIAYNLLAVRLQRIFAESQVDDTNYRYVILLNVLFALDILVFGVSIYIGGAIESNIYSFYLILLSVIGLLVSQRLAFLHAALALSVLALGFILQYVGLDAGILLVIDPPAKLVGNRVYLIRMLTVQAGFIILAVYLAGILRRKLLEITESERRSRLQSEALQKMTSTITIKYDLEESLNLVLETLESLVPFDSAVIIQIHKKQVQVSASRGVFTLDLTDELASDILKQEPVRQALKTRYSCLCQREMAEEPFNTIFRAEESATRSAICTPLIAWRKVVGVLIIGSMKPEFYSEEDAQFVHSLASSAALAIENVRLYGETQKAAITDGLTDVYNRRSLDPMLEKEIARCKRYGCQLSVVFLDLDRFKQFNDYFGHLTGDDFLRDIASLFMENVRESDFVFRYGGDEFLAIMPEVGYPQVMELAERLRVAVEEHHFFKESDSLFGKMTVSVGIAVYPQDGGDANSIIAAADIALYKAKRDHNKVVAFSGTSDNNKITFDESFDEGI